MAKSILQSGDDVADGLPLVSPEEQVSNVMQQQTARDSKAGSSAWEQSCNWAMLNATLFSQVHVQRATTSCIVPVRTLGTGRPATVCSCCSNKLIARHRL
jgi:hypothetical protein